MKSQLSQQTVNKDKAWYALVRKNYNDLAKSLKAQGYRRVQASDGNRDYFERNGERLVIVRKLGVATWYTQPYEEPQPLLAPDPLALMALADAFNPKR